ncbi:uncharacterized protein LOC143277367 [Babylonia areolata]|uniref:uncharacterized protein LOC143277367 n=1 Tax=Babylonia areolata TaxID=304850 RepID=UPI003FD606C4
MCCLWFSWSSCVFFCCVLLQTTVHAELSTPTLTVTTPATGSGWTVRGNVDITRIFSSAGQYSCVWEEKRPGSGSYTQIVNKAPTIDPPASSTSVRTGRCDFPDRTLSATAGTYTYRVTVSPGQTVKTDSSVVLETPATPSISCSPTGYVSEGGELTCTCSGDVGRPAGRLQLFRESTNTFTPGQYGGNTLQETLTVSKADNGKKVRCDVDWITDITGPVITLRVAIHAELSTPTLTVTTPATGSGWTVRGNVDITRIFSSAGQYSCVWEEKRPGSGSYTQIVNKAPTIDPPASSTSVRTGRCDFPDRTLSATAGTYTYRVTVSPGQTVKTDSSAVVETPATPSISCSPTGYVSEGGELTCTCSGDVGRPAGRLQLFRESTNTFTPSQYDDNTLPVTLTVNRADNGTKLRCDVDWITDITGPVITLRVATEARFVQLSLNGQSGTLELSTDQTTDVLFQCEASGIPAPDLVLTDGQRRELARLEGSTNRSVQHSVLRYSVSRARCEDSGTYTCTAENGVGNPVSTSSSLTVWCTMQVVAESFGSQVDELGTPVITAADRGGKLHFELVTSERPNVVSFLYLGDVPSGLGQPPETGLFRLNCEETTVVYKTSCVIMASNVTEDTAGYYNVSMSASKGTTSFVFRLKLSVNVSTDKESEDGSEDGTVISSGDGCDTKACFGIGFAAGFGTMLAVVAGAVFWLWRHKWRLSCAGEEPVHKTTDDLAVRTEAPLAMSTIESDVATNDTGPYEDVRSEIRAVSEAPHTSHTSDTGPYEELKPIDIGLKSVYSAMSPPPHTSGTDDGYEIPAKDPAPAAASRI